MSGTLSIYMLTADGKAKKESTLKVGNFDEGAAKIISYDPKGEQLYVTNSEKKTVDIIDVSIPAKPMRAGAIDFSAHTDSLCRA